MIDRRALIALGLAAPLIAPLPRLDLPDPRIGPLNTNGVTLFGISPNATVLVGSDPENRIVFLDAETRFQVSQSSAVPELRMFTESSVSWNPGGTRIAFDLEAWRLQRDSDIFVVDVTSGEVTNVTPEGHADEAASLMDDLDVMIDISPVWLDDDTILFARHHMNDRDNRECGLFTLSVPGGEVEPYVDLAALGVFSVSSKIWRLSDGSLVFMADFADRDFRRGAVMVSPDGEVTDIHPGMLDTTNYISVNDTHLLAFDVQDFAWRYMALDDSVETVPLWEHFPMPDGWTMVADPILGPDPDSMFAVFRTDNDKISAQLYTDREPLQLGELEGELGRAGAHWADDVILVTSETNSWLLSQKGPGR